MENSKSAAGRKRQRSVNEASGAGKTCWEQEQYRFSGTHLEVNAIFPLTVPTCLAAFSPDVVRPPPPTTNDEQYTGPEVDLDTATNDEQYTGPEVDLDTLLNTRF